MYTNAQSLAGKVNELSCTAVDLNPDLILLTETWLNKDISDAYLTIPGYELKSDLRMDREVGRGGGLAVYAKNGIKILKLDHTVTNHIQICKFLVNDVTVSLVYRPPSAPTESIAELEDAVRAAGKNSLLIGDFNLPNIDWEKGMATGKAADFMAAVEDCMMDQLVSFPTQVKGNILDLVVTNIPERVNEVSEQGRLGKSDHVIILASVSVGRTEKQQKPSQDWRKANWDAMRTELRRADLQSTIRMQGADEAWKTLRSTVNTLIEQHVPARRLRNSNRPAWMTQNILREIRRKKKLWKMCRGQATEEYKAAEKKVKNMVRNAKRNFEKKLAEGNGGNKRPFFAYVKKKTNSRPSIGPLKDSSGQTVTSDEGMAEILNKAFQEAFTREDTTSIPVPEDKCEHSFLESVRFQPAAVKRKIRELRTDAASGPDGLGPKVLQELQDELSPVLAAIFEKSLDEGTVPEDWKEANVTPIYKKGTKSSPGNYRPVSLTSISCKLMESILRDAITDHLTANRLIKDSQHGFMKDKSCVTNLLEFLEKATTVVDGGDGFDVIYLDFAKAFDKVPRERLLNKVRAHGIRGRVLGWIRGWLTGRRQRVVLNGRFSSWEEVLSGVPQGSVLGPLLFLIFINDMDDTVEHLVSILRKFADDTKLGKRVRTEKERQELQEALDRLCEWASMWGMQFNVSKCKVMHMGHANPKFSYSMNGQELEETEEERDIGVVISSNMKPSAQCAVAARTAQGVLGQITRAFHYRDRHVFMRLYKQYVRPHLEFSTQAWAPWTEADKACLEKVQQRAVRQVSGLASTSYEDRLLELNLPSLEERRHQADMCMVHKILQGRGGLNPETWFEMAGDSARPTRAGADPLNIRVRHGRLDMRRNFFSLRVIEDWNKIPPEVKRLKKSEVFKRTYKQLRADQLRRA